MPGCKYVVDLHSGGSSLMYHGGVLLAVDPGQDEARQELRSLMQRFDVPHACLLEKGTVRLQARRKQPVDLTIILARQEGLEPPTPGLEGPCSIQLSYCRAMW